MRKRDASRDKGTIGVTVCPFGESVRDDADWDEQSDENARHTRSRTGHVIWVTLFVCVWAAFVLALAVVVGAQNLAIQDKTSEERPELIILLSTHPTIVPAHPLPRPTIPNLAH